MREFFGTPTFQVIWNWRRPIHDVRRLQFEFEDLFKPLINAPSVAVQLPPTGPVPPMIPRFTMNDGTRGLAVSNIGATLTQNFSAAPSKGFESVLSKSGDVINKAGTLLSPSPPYFGDLSLAVDFSLANKKEGLKAIAAGLFRHDSEYEPSLLNVSYGESRDGLINSVEVLTFLNYPQTNDPMSIDADFTDPLNESLKLRVTCSTKPSMQLPPEDIAKTLISGIRTLAHGRASAYLPKDLLVEISDRI